LTADIIELARQYGRYGYRKIAALLRAAGWLVNDKRVERIWRRECRSASNLGPPKARARAEPSGATLRCAPPGSAPQLHNLGNGQLFDADPGHGFGAV